MSVKNEQDESVPKDICREYGFCYTIIVNSARFEGETRDWGEIVKINEAKDNIECQCPALHDPVVSCHSNTVQTQ